MKPYLLQGHERPITSIQFNYDGDLLFTASKDHVPSVWRTENGDRLGTFNGHKGTIWDLDVNRFTTYLLTASADATCRLWDCENGRCLQIFQHIGPVRGVAWAEGKDEKFATISDPFMEHNAMIRVYQKKKQRNDNDDDGDDDDDNDDDDGLLFHDKPTLEIEIQKINGKRYNPTTIQWSMLNELLIVSYDNGKIKCYDPETGHLEHDITAHENNKKINRIRMNRDKTLLITSSADFTSKLYDPITWKELKVYRTDRPVNDAVISEHHEHILLGGGQEAMSVTTTAGKVGKFETRFFHLVYQEEFGTVKGHFGPINALDVNPNGRSYASGAEDGYVRLHIFDKDYLEMKDPVPEEEDDDDDNHDDNEVEEENDEMNNNNIHNDVDDNKESQQQQQQRSSKTTTTTTTESQ